MHACVCALGSPTPARSLVGWLSWQAGRQAGLAASRSNMRHRAKRDWFTCLSVEKGERRKQEMIIYGLSIHCFVHVWAHTFRWRRMIPCRLMWRLTFNRDICQGRTKKWAAKYLNMPIDKSYVFVSVFFYGKTWLWKTSTGWHQFTHFSGKNQTWHYFFCPKQNPFSYLNKIFAVPTI